MNNKIKIINAVPEDAKGIINVLYKTWLDTYPNKEVGITEEDIEEGYKDAFTDEKIKNLQEKIANIPPNHKRIVAKYKDKIVGVATMGKNETSNQLKTIYVLPEFQGKGIGKMMWNELKKFCDPTKDILVEVATYNKNTIEFYKRFGFVDTGRRFNDSPWRMKGGPTIPQMEMRVKAQE